ESGSVRVHNDEVGPVRCELGIPPLPRIAWEGRADLLTCFRVPELRQSVRSAGGGEDRAGRVEGDARHRCGRDEDLVAERSTGSWIPALDDPGPCPRGECPVGIERDGYGAERSRAVKREVLFESARLGPVDEGKAGLRLVVHGAAPLPRRR